MEKIFIKPQKRFGSLWIYKNEIVSDIENIEPGSIVKVYEYKREKIIGTGYINPKSVISIRLLSFHDEKIDDEFLKKRIQKSIQYRQEFLGLKGSYRAVFSESDMLPGLIVDKYENCLVMQISTAGMERLKDKILSIFDEIYSPETIILKNDSQARLKEGLEIERKIVKGNIDELPIIHEDDVRFIIDPIHGQKTGFFLDQRENRLYLKQIINSGEGLDLFCYLGAWSVHLAKRGASVTGIDSSDRAIELAKKNAEINNLSDRCKFIKADAFDYLKWEIKKGNKYDFIIADPPAFVKSRSEKRDAIQGYLNLNLMCVKLLKKNGILITSSCSQHISEMDFSEIVKEAFLRNRKTGVCIYKGTQSKDHPVLLSMPETIYLKCFIVKAFD